MSATTFLVVLSSLFACQTPEVNASPARTLTLVDEAGMETNVATYRMTQGSKPLSFLMEGNKKQAAPIALEFREEGSTTFANGIVTLVPMSAVEEIAFDADKKAAQLKVKQANDSVILKGTTKFIGINRVVVEYEQDLPGLGLALLKFRGGEPKGTGRRLRFSAAEAPAPVPPGRKAVVIARDKEKTRHEATGLAPLYQIGAEQRLLPELAFQIDVRLRLDSILKMSALPPEKKQTGLGFTITKADKSEVKLLLRETLDQGKASARLLGLLGRVPVGYKLFPLHACSEITFLP